MVAYTKTDHYVRVWGHRGCRQNQFYYENSTAAHNYALKKANGFETDVIGPPTDLRLTHDTLFTDHVNYELAQHLNDKSRQILAAQTQQPPYLYLLPGDVIPQLRLKNDTPLPRVEDTLKNLGHYPLATINLELKGPGTWRPALAMVNQYVADGIIKPKQITFSSFNLPVLAELREEAGLDYKIGVLLSKEDQTMTPNFPDWPHLSKADAAGVYTPFSAANIQSSVLQAIQPDYFNLEWSVARRENAEKVAKLYPDAKIITWAIGEVKPDQSPTLLRSVTDLYAMNKLHAVITDFPEEMLSFLEQNNIPVQRPN